MQRLALVIAVITLAGCSTLRFPGVYRIDIPQGNIVTKDMLEDLRPGMTREQVRYVLGPPALRDPFTPDRWYYLLDYKPGEGEPVRQEIVVHFDGEKFSHREGQAVANLKARTSGRRDRELKKKVRQGQDEIEETVVQGPQPATSGGSSESPGGAPSPSPAPGPTTAP
jgi:outer membrane protein assembly factor BamE